MALTSTLLTQIRDDVKTDLGIILLYGAVGESATAASPSDTALGLEVFRDARTAFDTSVSNAVTMSFEVGASEANNNTIQEMGLFNNAIEVVDACDAITGWTDSADMTISVNSSEYKENTAALNLTKDGTSSTTASTSKTTTSIDFTSKNLSIWLYIDDTATLNKLASSAGFKIQYGSDNSNYYEWERDRSELSVGWNLIQSLTSSNPDTTTGSPVITAMDYTNVVLTTTNTSDTWTAGKVIMDDIKVRSGSMWLRNTLTSINKTDDVTLFLDTTITITVTET